MKSIFSKRIVIFLFLLFVLMLLVWFIQNRNHFENMENISSKDDVELVQKELNLIPLKIHLTNVTYEDFIEMLKTKEQTVVSEAIKKNIILFGIEEYYRLLENVR